MPRIVKANKPPKQIVKEIPDAFYDYIFDWNYETYVVCGGYGSGKSYDTAFKIITKLCEEKRTALVVREVYDTIFESCYSLIYEILDEMDLLKTSNSRAQHSWEKVLAQKSPLQFRFPNGSRIIFKGMDRIEKIKSINNVSIVWLEEATEIKAAAYTELRGRVRVPDKSMHFFLTFNPVDKNNWCFRTFFERTDDFGKTKTILDDNELYDKKIMTKGKVYYHHSTPDDNPNLPDSYIERLDELIETDPDLYRVARLGHFGANGIKVLPNFTVAETNSEVYDAVRALGEANIRTGMDFGFEESYNAVINCAVDLKEKILYIYREYYKNHMTDLDTVKDPEFQRFKKYTISADSEDPKAIQFYRDMGYKMRKCKKFPGSRLSYTRKMRRFRKIICAPYCVNTIKELQDLTYKKDKQGNMIYDEFNIDPHTFRKCA